MTGNGTFDAVTDWAESFLKLQYSRPAGGRPGSIAVVDWWTPWSDQARSGGELVAEESAIAMPTNFRAYAVPHMQADGEWADMDLGSGGPVLVDDLGLVLGAGKDGILYVLKKNVMGKTTGGVNLQKLKPRFQSWLSHRTRNCLLPSPKVPNEVAS
jgi:hypothetical protein